MNMPPDKNPDKKRKKSLRDKFNESFPDVSKDEWKGIIRDTIKDLGDPKEIALLLGGVVVPGGFIGYGAWRILKYREKKAANDNPPPPPAPEGPSHKKSAPKKGKDSFKP